MCICYDAPNIKISNLSPESMTLPLNLIDQMGLKFQPQQQDEDNHRFISSVQAGALLFLSNIISCTFFV